MATRLTPLIRIIPVPRYRTIAIKLFIYTVPLRQDSDVELTILVKYVIIPISTTALTSKLH